MPAQASAALERDELSLITLQASFGILHQTFVMQNWLASGKIGVAIVILTVFEATALLLYHRITGRGVTVAAFLPNLLAGDFLLIAWAMIAMHWPWQWSALALIGSLSCHLTDLYCRWSRP